MVVALRLTETVALLVEMQADGWARDVWFKWV
jgi:hypothetical protein